MRQSQAEIKAIEAELRSIRADNNTSSKRSVTLLEPDEPQARQAFESAAQPISPTIVRQSSPEATTPKSQKPTVQTTKQRSVECFPISHAYTQTNAVTQAQLNAVIKQLDQSSNQTVQQFKQVQSQFLQAKTQAKKETIRHILEEKAKQINCLSNQQEMIILELMTISEQLEQEQQRYKTRSKQTLKPFCEYVSAEVPYIEKDINGTLILTTRSIDSATTTQLPTTQQISTQEALANAELLRHRSRKKHRGSLLHWLGRNIWNWTWSLLKTCGAINTFIIASAGRVLFGQATSRHKEYKYRGSGRRAASTEIPFTLQEAAILTISSALLRIGLDWVVASHPALWLPSVLFMITPALLAVYRSTVMPQTGFAWGYRLFSIMIGLLLGGRL